MSNITIIAYIILTLSIGYVFIYPKTGEISSLLEEKQKYENTLEVVNNIENKKNELLTEFNKISTQDRKNIETILPSSLNFVKLVAQIDKVAMGYGIIVDKFSSKETSFSVGDSIATAQPSKPYNSAVISFSFKSPYDKFSGFINDLEKSLRILDVRSTKLETQEKDINSYQVEFETYWLKSD